MLKVLSLDEKRAVREPGKRMRSRLLDAAVDLFRAQGLSGVVVADIAAAAGAFPSQVTYYFRTKEALFVEAGCREMLYVARQIEQAGARCMTSAQYNRTLVETVFGAPGLALFVEVLALARRRQDLAPLVERTFERLHAEGDRAYADVRLRRGWPVEDDPAITARRFWTLALGIALRSGAVGATPGEAIEEMLALMRYERTSRRGKA